MTVQQPPAGVPAATAPAQVDDGALGSPLGRAATLMVVYLAVLWAVDLVNAATGRTLYLAGGIRPRDPDSLVDIVTAPFLHANLQHLGGNALPLFSLGFIAALPGLRRFLGVTAVVIVVSGLGVWLFSPTATITVGASGVVFGYLGYLLLRGLVDRRPVDVVVSVGIVLAYGYLLWISIGFQEGVSWQGHAAGLFGGLLAAWFFRTRRARPARQSDLDPPATPQPEPPTA